MERKRNEIDLLGSKIKDKFSGRSCKNCDKDLLLSADDVIDHMRHQFGVQGGRRRKKPDPVAILHQVFTEILCYTDEKPQREVRS